MNVTSITESKPRRHDPSAAQMALQASEQRLAAQSKALTELTTWHTDQTLRFDERLRVILATSAATLDVDRVSMWCFDIPRLSITCTGLHDRSTERDDTGAIIWRADAPAYFEALDRDRLVASEDVSADPRTRELYGRYLAPQGIGALLDVPLRKNGRTMGVLCVEHVGGPRAWTVDEQNFALSAANLVMVAATDQERRDALDRLAESEARARLIIDTAHDAFVGMNEAGHIIGWNAQAEATFGWTREEALGRNLAETIVPPAYRHAHALGMQRFLETGDAPVVNRRLELTALDRAGREFPVEITITAPIRVGGGFTFGAFLRDISERRERDEQLRCAKEAAEAATRAKSEFLANMSHELRTPLNAVLGYAQLLRRDRTLTGSQHEALEAIARGGSHLLELINDVLDLSKIESGRIDVESAPADLRQLMTDLEYVHADAARRKNLRLTLAIDPGVPRRAELDGRHLRQVLINLIGNAIKFTHEGEVRLRISMPSASTLLFEVSDTGAGIEPESLSEVYEAFTQTPAGAAAGGTGLGLTISRRLVEAMGGTLGVESTLGQGSRFHVSLPFEPAPDAGPRGIDFDAPPRFDARLADGEDLLALVADDSTVNRRILVRLLESAGARVIQATDGREAIQLAREHRPDMIFMDVRMPDVDGLEATRRLKADPATSDIPVIVVTASAFGDTRQAAREAGCVDYLPKPVRAESLFAALRLHLGTRFVSEAETAAGLAPDLDPARAVSIAARLETAAGLGSVTDLEGLVDELRAGAPAEAALSARVAQLAAGFDFDGLRALASDLAGQPQ